MPGISVSKICVPFGGGGIDWSSYWTTHFVWGLRTIVVDTGSIKLDWVNVGNNAVAIERSLDGTSFTQVGTAAAGAETYTDTGLATATDYWYRIRPYSGSQYGDYTSIQTARTLPVSNKYPLVETTNWNNTNHAIRDIRLYVPDDSITYYLQGVGYTAYGGGYYLLKINNAAGTEVVGITYNAASYFDKDDYARVYFNRRSVTDLDISGWIDIKFSAITGGAQYSWQMPSNLPNIVAGCVKERNPLYDIGESLVIDNSFVISGSNALYAHESSMLIKDKIICVYTQNTSNQGEDHNAQACIMTVINKTTNAIESNIIIAAYNGTYGGMAFSANSATSLPRIYELPDGTIRIYFWYNSKTYYRDLDYATLTLGDTHEFTAIISGGTEPVSLTAENIQAHCEAVSGESQAYFSSLNFYLRDSEVIHSVGGTLYLLGEFANSKPSDATVYIPTLMKSSDGGHTWELQGIIYEDEAGAMPSPSYCEANCIYYSNKWYIFVRNNNTRILSAESSDNGATWTKFNNYPEVTIPGTFPQGNYGLRNAIIPVGSAYIIAYTYLPNVYRTAARSAAAIGYVTEMGNISIRAIINSETLIHYLALALDNSNLYVSYTTNEKTGGGQNVLKNTIRIAKIALTDL